MLIDVVTLSLYFYCFFQSTSACEASTKDFHFSDESDSTEQYEEKEGSEDKFKFAQRHFEMPYTFGINTTPGYGEHNRKRQDRRLVSHYCTNFVHYLLR